MNQNQNSALKMGHYPINKLVFSMALPPMFSLVVQSLYNIIDSIYISGYSEAAFTAVSLAFPIQVILISLAGGLSVGLSSLISIKLGEKDYHGANNVAEHGIVISIMISLVVLLAGLFLSKYFFHIFTDDKNLIELGTIYISIIMVFSFARFIAQSFISIFQGCGSMVIPMVSQIIGAVVNIIFDPILIYGKIFGLYLFEPLGISGAAYATIIGQVCAFIYLIIAFITKDHLIKLNIKDFKYHSVFIKKIVLAGLPAGLAQGSYSFVVIGLNLILASISLSAVTALGAYYKLNSIYILPAFGISAGLIPICGYNYGAKNYNRMKKAIKVGVLYAMPFGFVAFFFFMFLPETLLSIFSLSDDVVKIGVVAFKAISIVFPLSCFNITFSSIFQGIGKSHINLGDSLFRTFFVLLPSAYILFNFVGINYGWYAFLIANIFSITYYLFQYKKVKKTFI